MRCERAQELLSEYCDGTLPNAMRVAVDGHIGACAECRQAVEELRIVWKSLDGAPIVTPPAGFRASVLQRLDAQQTEKAESGWLQRLLASVRLADRRRLIAWGAAALLLVVLAGITVPGSRSAAWLGIGRPGDARSQFVAAQPRLETQNGRAVLAIPLHLANPDGKLHTGPDIRIRVRVIGASTLNPAGAELVITGGGPAVAVIPIDHDRGPITLEVTRLDGREPASQILTIPVPRP